MVLVAALAASLARAAEVSLLISGIPKGKLTSATLHANRDTAFTVYYHGTSSPVRLKKRDSVRLNEDMHSNAN
jgi:hypothetical protein